MESKNENSISAVMWRLTHYQHDTYVADDNLKGGAAAFTNWNQLLTASSLSNRTWAATFLRAAEIEATRAGSKAAHLAAKKFQD